MLVVSSGSQLCSDSQIIMTVILVMCVCVCSAELYICVCFCVFFRHQDRTGSLRSADRLHDQTGERIQMQTRNTWCTRYLWFKGIYKKTTIKQLLPKQQSVLFTVKMASTELLLHFGEDVVTELTELGGGGCGGWRTVISRVHICGSGSGKDGVSG